METEKKVLTKEEYFNKYKKHTLEVGKNQQMTVDYPKPIKCHRIFYESPNLSIETPYFWLLNFIRYDLGFSSIDKITDIFSASEHSAFFGAAQQRLGLQQDKVTAFLATIGKMVKDMFQIVRELRIIDERLGYYNDSYDKESKSRESAEITLKGIWIDLVEGGSKNPASVYGLARELQFTTLPDLFFGVHPLSQEDVDETVDKLEFNNKVKEVLRRKLRQYLGWKESTHKEMSGRRNFTIKYLRQHYDIIKMYMNWAKPYLRNIRRLNLEGSKTDTPDLVAAFEGSMVELEILAKSMPENNKECYGVVLIHFEFRTKPSLSYHQEGYQRGPIHIGEAKITWRFYTWTDLDIENYKSMREQDDLELLSSVDSSLKAAMDSLGDDMMAYLQEAGEKFPSKEPEKKEEKPKPSLFGFIPPAKPAKPKKKKGESESARKERLAVERKNAEKVKALYWLSYKIFKQAHGMATW